MSQPVHIPDVTVIPSTEPSELTIQEMVEYSASKRQIAAYERQIRELTAEKNYYRLQANQFASEWKADGKYREACARLKRGKLECFVQLVTVSLLTGAGGLLMAAYPRSEGREPHEFWIGVTLTAVGLVIALVVRPIVLFMSYWWPNYLGDDPRRE